MQKPRKKQNKCKMYPAKNTAKIWKSAELRFTHMRGRWTRPRGNWSDRGNHMINDVLVRTQCTVLRKL